MLNPLLSAPLEFLRRFRNGVRNGLSVRRTVGAASQTGRLRPGLSASFTARNTHDGPVPGGVYGLVSGAEIYEKTTPEGLGGRQLYRDAAGRTQTGSRSKAQGAASGVPTPVSVRVCRGSGDAGGSISPGTRPLRRTRLRGAASVRNLRERGAVPPPRPPHPVPTDGR